MNDLVVSSKILDSFPQLKEGLEKAVNLFSNIKSWEDVELHLLRGNGLTQGSYKNYMVAIRELYHFTNGLNPLQVQRQHIESFYDSVTRRVTKTSACVKVAALKRFFKNLEEEVPGYESPFKSMSKKLLKKMGKKSPAKQNKALTPVEVRRMLAWLEEDQTVLGKRNYGIFLFLTTSGLRVAEFCSLRWRSIEQTEEGYFASFTGKGSKPAYQELFGPAVGAAEKYFQAHFKRKPRPDDALFFTCPTYSYDPIPVYPLEVWQMLKDMGKVAREKGVVKREIVWSCHMLRRTYATCLYRAGMKIRAIQAKTRHENIQTLLKHYVVDEDPAQGYIAKFVGIGNKIDEN